MTCCLPGIERPAAARRRREPATGTHGGQEMWSFSFIFPTRSSRSAVTSALRSSRSVRRASRAAASAASSAASSSLHDLGDRTARHLAAELGHLAVDHLDRRLRHARDHGGRLRRHRPPEGGERLVGLLGAIEVEELRPSRRRRPSRRGHRPARPERRRASRSASRSPSRRGRRCRCPPGCAARPSACARRPPRTPARCDPRRHTA